MSGPPIVEELTSNDEWVACDTEKQDGGLQPSRRSDNNQGLTQPKAELSNSNTKQIARGVDCSDCIEKDDLVHLVRAEGKTVPPEFSGATSPPPASVTTSDSSSLQQEGKFKSISKGFGRSFRKVVEDSQKVTRGIGGSLKQLAGFGFGSIHLELPKRHFYSGDNIQGQIKLNLEQPIQADHLVVSLVGTQRRDSSRDQDEGLIDVLLAADERKTVYEFPVKLETKRVYNPGETFSFNIPVPDSFQGSGFARLALGLVQGALAAMDNRTGEVEWSVVAKLLPATSFVPLTESVRILVEEKKTSVKSN